MKNYIVGFCGLLITIVSCRKVDDSSVFSQSADQRINAALAKYQSKLSGAPYGWKATVETKAGGNFTFYFSFNDSNRVKMISSFDDSTASVVKESSYRLKALQQPSLLFDTYSYLHMLADPNPATNGGAAGAGLVTDFEFYFDDANSSDSVITLVGRFNGTKTVLTKATQAEQSAFLSGELARGLAITKILTYFKKIVINNTDSADTYVDVRVSHILQQDPTGNLLDTSLGATYALTLGGLSFDKPLTIGTKTITGISDINFDPNTTILTATTSGGEPIVIRPVIIPNKVDVAAPRRWRQYAVTQDNTWKSLTGFHVNGVDDAYNATSFTFTSGGAPWFFLWFQYQTGTNDVLYPLMLNQSGDNADIFHVTFARVPTVNASGIMIFREAANGSLPDYNPFSPATSTLGLTRSAFYDTRGYYFVQTGDKAYDMIKARDGKTWIHWEM